MKQQHDIQTTDVTATPTVVPQEQTSGASRRKFLTKATAGLVVASLPARSVWASGGGIAQSIVASGNGSDFAGGIKIAVLSPGYWMNHEKQFHAINFHTVFGGCCFDKNGRPILPTSTTFGQILLPTAKKATNTKGVGNCNFHMVGMYLNALNHGSFGINYPVVGFGQPFATMSDFARYLYSKAMQNPSALGRELSAIIDEYHA